MAKHPNSCRPPRSRWIARMWRTALFWRAFEEDAVVVMAGFYQNRTAAPNRLDNRRKTFFRK